MGKFAHITTHIGAATAAVILALCLATPVEAVKHPTLVSPAKAKCAMCHDEILEKPVVHPPAEDDCLSCHDFEKTEDGLQVSLMADGVELCIMCHDGMEAAAMGEIEAPHAPVVDDCTSCHSPHSSDEKFLLSVPAAKLCFECHDLDDINSVHPIPVSRADCRSCHRPHGSGSPSMLTGSKVHAPFEGGMCTACHRKPRGTKVRLRHEGSKLCYACHGDLVEDFAIGEVHTAVAEGNCTGCHDPHLTDFDKLLKTEGSALCFPCHADIKAKVEGDGAHAAVLDGCDGCHSPHNGEHRAQLHDATPDLCLMCHDADDADLKAKHLGADLTSAACTTCHDPHGSDGEHLLATGSIHPPFLDDCESCHEGSASDVIEDGGKDLCYACHSDIEETVNGSPVQHAAMEMAECVDCHSPHASPNPSLLREAGPSVCTTCHEDQAAGKNEVNHGVIEWFGCQSCHQPHGSANENLLNVSGNVLCNGCHLRVEIEIREGHDLILPNGLALDGGMQDALHLIDLDDSRTKDHPLPSHPVSGEVTGKGRMSDIPESLFGTTLSCLSCHSPHKGANEKLFVFGATTEFGLCSGCHPK